MKRNYKVSGKKLIKRGENVVHPEQRRTVELKRLRHWGMSTRHLSLDAPSLRRWKKAEKKYKAHGKCNGAFESWAFSQWAAQDVRAEARAERNFFNSWN